MFKKDLLILKTVGESKFVGGNNAGKSRTTYTYISTSNIASVTISVAEK